MAFENLRKASAIAAASMSAIPAVPVVANRAGRPFWRGSAYSHEGARENPIERLKAEADEACRNLRELEGLISRAKSLCNLAEARPYAGGNWTATPTPEQAKDIREARRVLKEFDAAWAPTFKAMESAVEQLNLKLRGNG